MFKMVGSMKVYELRNYHHMLLSSKNVCLCVICSKKLLPDIEKKSKSIWHKIIKKLCIVGCTVKMSVNLQKITQRNTKGTQKCFGNISYKMSVFRKYLFVIFSVNLKIFLKVSQVQNTEKYHAVFSEIDEENSDNVNHLAATKV